MGYRSYWSLEVDDPNDMVIIAEFRRVCDYAEGALEFNGSCSGESFSWYDSEKDLKSFSSLHPNVLFTLSGEGEDGERWRTYAKDGKSFTANGRIVYEEFSEDKLE
jgi:hypothetical protein